MAYFNLRNACFLKGRLTKDAEVRKATETSIVANFSIALNKKVKGEDVVTFANCTYFLSMESKLPQYLKKGQEVTVVAEYQLNRYDKDGVTKSYPYFNVVDLTLDGGRNSSTSAPAPEGKAEEFSQYGFSEFGEEETDIPF